MATVLYVDRQSPSQARVVRGLASRGFRVDAVASAGDAERLATHNAYDCALAHYLAAQPVDVVVFCSHLRGFSSVVIVLVDVVDTFLEGQLLDCGVDDVIDGARATPELIAKRIHARLRRPGSRQLPMTKVAVGDAIIDFARRTVQREGAEYQLPGLLADLLYYFIDNVGHIVSRQELHESSIWADSICTGPEEGGKTFDMHISRLRRVIEKDPSKPMLIQSVRGVGWKLAARPVWESETTSRKEGLSLALVNPPIRSG